MKAGKISHDLMAHSVIKTDRKLFPAVKIMMISTETMMRQLHR